MSNTKTDIQDWNRIVMRHNPSNGKIAPTPDWGAKDLKLGTLRAIIRQLGLDWKAFTDAKYLKNWWRSGDHHQFFTPNPRLRCFIIQHQFNH